MRIGTWNLDAKWSEAHRILLTNEHCDVWLLTEVSPKARCTDAKIAGYHSHLSAGVMAAGQHWAAVLSRLPLTPYIPATGLHEASAAALVNGVTYCSTILPWSGCTNHGPNPWVGRSLAEMARPAIECLKTALPKSNTVWGGDWNQNLAGGWQHVGSSEMRKVVELALSFLELQVGTAELTFQSSPSQNTIDHIAMPLHWTIRCKPRQITAAGLSSHDAYIIEVDHA